MIRSSLKSSLNFKNIILKPKLNRYLSNNQLSNVNSTNDLVHKDSEWTEMIDPKGSGQVYYWNKITNEVTALGEAIPDTWKAVGEGSNMYWWNVETNQTTSVGAPKPMRYSQVTNIPTQTQNIQSSTPFNMSQQPQQSFGSSMMTYGVLGFSMSLGIILVKSLF
jgi:hypothetical protein